MSIRYFLTFALIHIFQISISAQELDLSQLVCKSELYYKNDTLFTGHFTKKLRDCRNIFVFQEGDIINGEIEGRVKFKNSKAELIGDGVYLNGIKEGEWKDVIAYEIECGEPNYVRSNGTYLSGKKIGFWKENIRNVGGYEEGAYQNNKREGDWKVFGYYNSRKQNYKKSHEGKYINGKKNGIWKQWRFDGKLSEIKNYENDSLEGDYVSYEYNRKAIIHSQFIIETGKYKNNKKVGHWKIYNWQTAKLWEEGEYVKGKKDMIWVHYKLDGKTVEYKEFYDEGVLIKNTVYSKNNKGEVVEYENIKNVKVK